MKKRFKNREEAVSYLQSRGVSVNVSSRTVSHGGKMGIKVLGAVDYLVNYHKFVVTVV